LDKKIGPSHLLRAPELFFELEGCNRKKERMPSAFAEGYWKDNN